MALFESLKETIAITIADAIGKYHKGFFSKRVLKTTDEVVANTNVKNLPSAVVVGELINDLCGVSFDPQPDGLYAEYMVGADAVRKKLGRLKKLGSVTSPGGTNRTQTASISTTDINGYKNLTADDFFVSITRCYMGNSSDTILTNGQISSVSHTYDPNAGVLKVSCVFTINTSNTKAVNNSFTANVYY